MPLFQNKEKEKKAKTEAPNTLTPPVEELEENGLQALEPEEPEKEVILNVMEIPIEYFEELQPLIQDVNITDVEFSSGDIWTIDISNTVRKRDDIHMTERQIRTLAERINISKASDFNNVNAVLETEAVTSTGENLRIEVLHHEYAQDGTELYIRKTPAFARLSAVEILKSGYASPEELSFLINAVKSNHSILIAGEPGAGKTELGKFLSQFIDKSEHVFVIEDTNEWHIKQLRPGLRNTSVIATTTGENATQTYKQAISHALRCNTNWLMISEIRGEEVVDYLKAMSTGLSSITTLHASDIKQIPNRLKNMTSNTTERFRIENEVHQNNIIGMVIERQYATGKRRISQIGYYQDEYDQNLCKKLFENHQMITSFLTEEMVAKFKSRGIDNPFWNERVANACEKEGIPFEKKEYPLIQKNKAVENVKTLKDIRL